ncbi:MAG: class I SAM-dependent methyltransferase [Candidatus Manganitrophaceae bacterium]
MTLQWDLNNLETIACDICNSNEGKKVMVRPDGLQVVECLNCGLSYINPRPKSALISRLYSREYYLDRDNQDRKGFGYAEYLSPESVDPLIWLAQDRYALLMKHTNIKDKRILEIGCATGEFCKVASDAGAQVIGSDYSKDAIEMAHSRYPQIHFIAGELKESDFPPESFDMIVAFEVIEHVLHPKEWMVRLSRLLRVGGQLVLSTPNYGFGRSIGVENWIGFKRSFEHLYFFSVESIRRIAIGSNLTLLAYYTSTDGMIDPSLNQPAFPLILRRAIGLLLRKLGILSSARKIRRELGLGTKRVWINEGNEHSLFIFLEKRKPVSVDLLQDEKQRNPYGDRKSPILFAELQSG